MNTMHNFHPKTTQAHNKKGVDPKGSVASFHRVTISWWQTSLSIQSQTQGFAGEPLWMTALRVKQIVLRLSRFRWVRRFRLWRSI